MNYNSNWQTLTLKEIKGIGDPTLRKNYLQKRAEADDKIIMPLKMHLIMQGETISFLEPENLTAFEMINNLYETYAKKNGLTIAQATAEIEKILLKTNGIEINNIQNIK